jgi:prepilin-type N-terminal cleavage/methylation domain-containing protein
MVTRSPSPPRDVRASDGFTLVELLVVMVVIGVLAAIAVPAFLGAKREAYEASAKADVRAITKEVLSLQVDDGTTGLTVSGSAGTWTVKRGATVVATGPLSEANEVSAASFVTASGSFCLSVRNTEIDAEFWTADDGGLREGDCAAAP